MKAVCLSANSTAETRILHSRSTSTNVLLSFYRPYSEPVLLPRTHLSLKLTHYLRTQIVGLVEGTSSLVNLCNFFV